MGKDKNELTKSSVISVESRNHDLMFHEGI